MFQLLALLVNPLSTTLLQFLLPLAGCTAHSTFILRIRCTHSQTLPHAAEGSICQVRRVDRNSNLHETVRFRNPVVCCINILTIAHHNLSPNSATSPVEIHVQYNTSHMYSVKPFASRSSPPLFNSLPAYCGRLLRSKKNSITPAGPAKMMYLIKELR